MGSEMCIRDRVMPPLNLSTCNCQAFSQEERDELTRRTENTLQKINVLKEELDALEGREEDPQYIEMQNNAENQIFYLEQIQKVLYSNCTSEAILAPTAYQSNIYA